MSTPELREPIFDPNAKPVSQGSAPPPTPEETKKTEGLLSALGTTALVSILLSWAVMVAYFSYFPPVSKPEHPKIMAVDMMMVGVTIAQMTNFDEEKTGPLFETVHQKLAQLRDEGIIVLDAGMAVALPPELVIEPQDLIPNVPDDVIKRNQEAIKMKTQTKMNMVTVPDMESTGP